MMNGQVKKLALAVGVALGGMGMVPSAQAVNIANNNQGQVLIFPYYTVNGGWSTLFGITNTSASVVVAKVRFREAYNSRDVFDFNIILSPRDVWTGWVAQNASGGASIFTEDTTCTVGTISSSGQPFPGAVSYSGPYADGGPTTTARANEGYVEVIMMGAVALPPVATPDPYALARGAVHAANGTPPGCAALVSAFQTTTGLATLRAQFGYDTAAGTGSAPGAAPVPGVNPAALNPLTGSFSLVNGITGLSTSGKPVTLANFWVPPVPGAIGSNTAVLAPGALNVALNNIITAQLPPASLAALGAAPLPFLGSWHEPSLNTANTNGFAIAPAAGPVAPASGALISSAGGANQNQTALLVPATGANAVSFVLNATSVINEWTRRTNPTAGWTTETDWVVAFPTKNFYVDMDFNNEFAGRNVGRSGTGAVGTFTLPTLTSNTVPSPFAQYFVNRDVTTATVPNNFLSPTPAVLRGSSCVVTTNTLYNREEASVVGQGFSPGGSNSLCYEANVLTFAGSNVLETAPPISQSLDTLPGTFGWMNLGLAATASTAPSTTGLPAVGFQLTVRTNSILGNTSLNSAAVVNHSYLP
ncbi:MAG TPA: hypothetical protein P5102_12575 [Candidatus Competibacteraceae bacterium]|nr:hypothetical protein [Candidatus Competibacteraceae bacterium]